MRSRCGSRQRHKLLPGDFATAVIRRETRPAEVIAQQIIQCAALPQGDAHAAREVVRRRHTRAQVLLIQRARACPERSRRVDRGIVPLNP